MISRTNEDCKIIKTTDRIEKLNVQSLVWIRLYLHMHIFNNLFLFRGWTWNRFSRSVQFFLNLFFYCFFINFLIILVFPQLLPTQIVEKPRILIFTHVNMNVWIVFSCEIELNDIQVPTHRNFSWVS